MKKCRTVNLDLVIFKRLFPDRFRPACSEERKACATMNMRFFFLSFLLKSARLICYEAEPRAGMHIMYVNMFCFFPKIVC